MLHIKIIVVGKTQEKYHQLAEAEYLKRLQRYAQVHFVIVRGEKITTQKSTSQILDIEAQRIQPQIERGDFCILLERTGREYSTEELAQFLAELQLRGMSRLAFIIGGPLGVASALLRSSQSVLSLSRLTFTHEMARSILLEQLYRAFTILNHEPYHK
ncbi:23S rRNA (pseudouridine(1915)-N(3))-methyltransferase RlmH [candidate division KSB1 bacterium]|nr:23S rRNA (pseudouridine(1915)-N(3))-methyltransferase RlmH [candidate division KSB1 bacterium]